MPDVESVRPLVGVAFGRSLCSISEINLPNAVPLRLQFMNETIALTITIRFYRRSLSQGQHGGNFLIFF